MNYYFNTGPFHSVAKNQSVRFHSDGDVSIAYTISGIHGPVIETWPDGFGVDRFNSNGTVDSSFNSFDLTVPVFGDETLEGVDTALLADGTFIIAANAGSDALLWRVKPGPMLAPFKEVGGAVALEAEIYTSQAPGTGAAANHSWSPHGIPASLGGGVALSAGPNTGVNTGDSTTGPRRDYAIDFSTTGIYYVWVRMVGASGTDDSAHVGLDGVLRSGGSLGFSGSSDWTWRDRTTGGTRVTLNVTTPGVHTLNLWMREDGVEVDSFILTKDAAFNPNTFDEFGGRVDFQAESFTGQAAGSGNAASHTWSQISDAAAGGGLALHAGPNSGVNTGEVTNGPRRDFAINFANTGTYYVWVRSSGGYGGG